jgi:peptide/nickel transport system substrate-binding protein
MQKKIRFYFRFLTAFVKKYFLLIVLGLLLAILSSFFLPKLLSSVPSLYSTINIGVVGRYSLPDLPLTILQKISLGLTSVDSSGKVSAGLASSWEISADGQVFTFTLNDKLKWQNGDKLKSSDIKYQFRDALIEYPNPSQLVIKLQQPFSPLPTLLSRPVLKVKSSPFLSRTKFIGTGNYSLSKFKSNGQILDSVTLNPIPTSSHLPTLKYFFYPSPQAAKTAFKLGLLNEIEDLPDPGDLVGWPNTEISGQPVFNRYVCLLFNTQDPDLSGQSGKTLRTALSYAIDKSGWENRAFGPINPESWVFNSEVKKYDYDLKKASDLLKKDIKVPSILKISTVPAYLSVAEQIKKDWEKLNIKSEISVAPDIASDFQILLIAQAIPIDPDQYNLWHSTQESTNLTRLNNPRIDKLLEDGRKTYNPDQRKKIYQDFQKYLVEEAPAVFLFYPESYTIIRK